MWRWPWEPAPWSGLSMPPGNLPQPPTASFLFIKPASACFAADGDAAKGASLPLALSPGPRPNANLPSLRSVGRIHLQPLPRLLPGQGFIMDPTPQIQSQLPFLQGCCLTSFLQTPHPCCCCHPQRCCSCRSIHPLRLPDTALSLSCSILSNSQLTNP